MRIRVCWYKNAGVAGYAEAFRPVQSDSQTSEWYSYFENDVLERVWKILSARCMSKYTEKWGVQIAGMIFQTLWSTHHKKSSGRGHRNFFCAIISLYSRYPEYVAVIYISIKQLIYNKISAEQIKDGFWFRTNHLRNSDRSRKRTVSAPLSEQRSETHMYFPFH